MTCFRSFLKRRNPGGFFDFGSFSPGLSWFFSMRITRTLVHTPVACQLQSRAPFGGRRFQEAPEVFQPSIQTPPLCPSARVQRIPSMRLLNAHVPGSPDDGSVVRFHGAEPFVDAACVHRVTNPVQHEPCRALHYSERLR
jgi:hypothetical protein